MSSRYCCVALVSRRHIDQCRSASALCPA
ncbi:putative leader peptide [Tomitella fengzijianii]